MRPNFEDESYKDSSPKYVRVHSTASNIKQAGLCLIISKLNSKLKKHFIAAISYFINHSRRFLKYLELSVIVANLRHL